MSDYSALISGTAGLGAYNRLGGAASPIVSETGNNVTFTGATPEVAGALVSDVADKALQFDGTDDHGALAIDLSGTNIVSVEFWLWWDAYANNDDFATEYGSPDAASGGVYIDPNGADGNIGIFFGTGGVGKLGNRYARSAVAVGQWDYWAVVIDKQNQTGTNRTRLYVNGALLTPVSSNVNDPDTSNFANSSFYLMSRTGSALFGAGKLDEFAVYPATALTSAQIQAHYQAGTVRHLNLLGAGA